MKLSNICPAPCFDQAPNFEIPKPGCSKAALKFASAEGRTYYSVLLRNHDTRNNVGLNPKIAIVGLSPAGTQIDEFVTAYKQTGDYDSAAIRGAFAGLSTEIIAMINGLGLASKLGLRLPAGAILAHHPDLYVTSLVACASLTSSGSSTDFDPSRYSAAKRCMTQRFLEEVLDPRFKQLTHILVLGSKGWKALHTVKAPSGQTIFQALAEAGKIVLNIPHPSGANREYVNLAVLPLSRMPSEDTYVADKWDDYCLRCRSEGKVPELEDTYKKKRRKVWNTIYKLRWDIAKLESRPHDPS
ncbi:hypothetical protein GFL21_15200 [Rhizobium anhuiense]|uniref:uracil-DNA glycosylase family protein n=1 Tax=Rhizobium anhuiense TaxID=1184720 RepID=UPI00144244C9|nr:hypothetical protein [Rhizobium anhuiense]NKM55857.1 hypothetical protein [Rhizobium anhuiense]